MTNDRMIVKPKTYLLALFLLFCGLLKSQDYKRGNFILELNNKDCEKLQFVEDSIFSLIKSNNFTYTFYDGLLGFDVPLTKAEIFLSLSSRNNNLKTNSYTVDMKRSNSYREFAIIGFSKDYKTELIGFSTPITRLTLNSYHDFFKAKEVKLINHTLKNNIAKKIDSNFITINEDSIYRTHRNIDFKQYNLFPQAPTNVLINIIQNAIFEGTIIAYSNDSLVKKLLKSEVRNYMSSKTEHSVFNEFGDKKLEVTNTIIEQLICNSIAISENIIFTHTIDSSAISKYDINIYPDQSKDFLPSLLLMQIKYKAIGVNYVHVNEMKTIWFNYNDVKSIIDKNNMNFDLYEAIFTKNLFDILEIENDYWHKSDYKK